MNRKAEKRFRKLCDAAVNHQVVMAQCVDVRTGRPAYVLCAVERKDGVQNYVPLARLFTGDPNNEVAMPGINPPMMV